MVIGAEVKDNLGGKKTHVYAKQVINATGPFADSLRQMSDPNKPSIIMPSAGMLPSLPLMCKLDSWHQHECFSRLQISADVASTIGYHQGLQAAQGILVYNCAVPRACTPYAVTSVEWQQTVTHPRYQNMAHALHWLCLSAGVHVTLPDYYSPEHLGMIVPKTKDGRVVFMLPWLDATIAGTTGDACLPLHTVHPLTPNLSLLLLRQYYGLVIYPHSTAPPRRQPPDPPPVSHIPHPHAVSWQAGLL